MSDQSNPAFQQALTEIPHTMYEQSSMATLASAAVGGVALAYAQRWFGPEVSVWFECISGGALHAAGAIADRRTSENLLDAMTEGEALGMPHPYAEGNPFIGPVKTTEEFKQKTRTPGMIAMEVGLTAISAIDWGFGLPIAMLRVVPAISNHKKVRRVRRAVDILREQTEAA